MAVCSDMLEAILGPIHSTCKPGVDAQESISEDAELDRTKNGKYFIRGPGEYRNKGSV